MYKKKASLNCFQSFYMGPLIEIGVRFVLVRPSILERSSVFGFPEIGPFLWGPFLVTLP